LSAARRNPVVMTINPAANSAQIKKQAMASCL
jgi:hypothetical protein